MRPSSTSSPTRLMLTLLQTLSARRGVKRIAQRCSSRPLRVPSIQPRQSASSTDSGHVRPGRPEPLRGKTTQRSLSEAPWASSQAPRSAASRGKKDSSTSTRAIYRGVGRPRPGCRDARRRGHPLPPHAQGVHARARRRRHRARAARARRARTEPPPDAALALRRARPRDARAARRGDRRRQADALGHGRRRRHRARRGSAAGRGGLRLRRLRHPERHAAAPAHADSPATGARRA